MSHTTVFEARTVLTMNPAQPRATHVAVRDGRILSVGSQDRMAHASELLRKIRIARLRVVEVPVTIRYTEHSMRKGQGGLQAVRILFDYFFRS